MTGLDQAIRARLDATTERAYPEMQAMRDALLAVLDLHKLTVRSDGREICTGCSDPKWNVYIFAPCETVLAIAEKLGVDAP